MPHSWTVMYKNFKNDRREESDKCKHGLSVSLHEHKAIKTESRSQHKMIIHEESSIKLTERVSILHSPEKN